MKQALISFTETISTEKIKDSYIVGIEWDSLEKNFLTKLDGMFIAISLIDTDISGNWSTHSKKSYAEKAIKEQGAKVFVFESEEEIINWLKS